MKYGQGQDQVRAGNRGGTDASNQSYAMFSNFSPVQNQNMAEVQKSQDLRVRKKTGGSNEGQTGGHIENNTVNSPLINGRSSRSAQSAQIASTGKRYNGSSSSGADRYQERDSSRGLNKPNTFGQQYIQMQQTQAPARTNVRSRVQGAEKVEKAIGQVRHLLTHYLMFIEFFKL